MDSHIVIMILGLLMGVPASYLLSVMILQERNDHYGPFRSKSRTVLFVSSAHEQPVVLFDWIRRLFGTYTIMEDKWIVEESRESVERFTCPFCLSAWIALPFTLIILLTVPLDKPIDYLFLFPVHFSIAIVSQLFYRWLY